MTDIIGSLLIAGALLSVALRPPAFLQSARHVVCLGLISLLCYQMFYFFPQTRVLLPSVRSLQTAPLAVFAFGENAPQEDFSGDWGHHTQEPIGSISWARQGDARITLTAPQREGAALHVVARPFVKSKAYTCFPLDIIVNGQIVQRPAPV